jgi:hypothetical protein
METSIQMPLDRDGYLRRACPACEREFKWLPQDNGLPAPTEGYHCPYCGAVAASDSWWTEDQLTFARAHAANLATDEVNKAFRGLRTSNRGPLQITITPARQTPVAPLVEPNDMRIVEAPCHPSEPIKVSENWESTTNCLYCGKNAHRSEPT